MSGQAGPKELNQGLCTCFNLRKATRLVTQLYDDALRPVGLRNTQFTLLQVVRSEGPIGMNDLAESVVTDRTTLTRNLKPLQRDGFLRINDADDKRVREVAITRKGERVLDRAYPLWEGAQDQLRDQLGTGKIEQLLGGLQDTVQVLRED